MAENLTKRLGQLLVDAVDEHIAPNVVDELAYTMLLEAGEDIVTAGVLSEHMFELARWVEPPADE